MEIQWEDRNDITSIWLRKVEDFDYDELFERYETIKVTCVLTGEVHIVETDKIKSYMIMDSPTTIH